VSSSGILQPLNSCHKSSDEQRWAIGDGRIQNTFQCCWLCSISSTACSGCPSSMYARAASRKYGLRSGCHEHETPARRQLVRVGYSASSEVHKMGHYTLYIDGALYPIRTCTLHHRWHLLMQSPTRVAYAHHLYASPILIAYMRGLPYMSNERVRIYVYMYPL
jgi:hypothetical protein